MFKIDICRFYYVVSEICNIHSAENAHLKQAFQFYDYDADGSIGSVDIVNLLKHFPPRKTEKIFRKYEQWIQERDERKNLKNLRDDSDDQELFGKKHGAVNM